MWQSRPVFISSTFVDMQAERDYLRTRVFPELEERLRGRRHNLEWVDLRVGVATASQHDEHVRELHVLKVCLDEVRRCRPFLIVLLGDRYGWVPPEERIKVAAEEARQGFSADVVGRSVTELEIEFGVLSDPEQHPRTYFYFRDPLPYADMPPEVAARYCEDYAADTAHADRKERLALLKRRIAERLPAHVRHYAGTWDGVHHCVVGLEDFGQKVLVDIWSELEAETKASAVAVDVPWQETEREALEDFIDDRGRDFVGRQSILASLTNFANAAESTGSLWGACVVGDPGSGKSALFGELYHRLSRSDVFLLAHAAGSSVNAASVDSMLRRWIRELAGTLGTDPNLADDADPDTVEATFARLLGQMAQHRRVVVLIDALDQFENTTRGRYVTWLPRLWPARTRFIATAIAGDASKALAERRGFETVPLTPLDATEARDIIVGICRRYHRNFEPEVIEALLAKSGPDGPAWSNPLWLVLAVEDLNLLDADDFARASRDYTGPPAEQLRALMLDSVAAFPFDIPGLYAHTFERPAELFGKSVARGFLGLIAVSRTGWREPDFRILLPRVSGENWDELKFAQLRRAFRGQLRKRGVLANWDFNHAQMRAAVLARLPTQSIGKEHLYAEHDLHTMIADRLLSCPLDDPLRISETMVHLLASKNYDRAAGYYADPSLSNAEVQGATRVLVEGISAPSTGTPAIAAQNICRLLDATDTAWRFLGYVSDPIGKYAPLDAQLIVFTATQQAFERLVRAMPGDTARRYNLGIAHERIGEVLRAQGDLSGALKSYQIRQEITRQLVQTDPTDADWQRDLGVALNNVGDLQKVQGDFLGALKSYGDALTITERLAQSDSHSSQRQRDLAACYAKIAAMREMQGDLPSALKLYRDGFDIVNRLAQSDPHNVSAERDRSTVVEKIGDVQLALGDVTSAFTSYLEGLVISDKLRQSDPGNAVWQSNVAYSYKRLGDVQMAGGDVAGALTSYRNSLAIRERLAQSDPSNTDWQRELAVSHEMVSDVQEMQQQLPEALSSRRVAKGIFERMANSDLSNVEWQSALSTSNIRVGDIRFRQGDVAGALELYRDSLHMRQRMAQSYPRNATWQRDLSVSYMKVGDAEKTRGDVQFALNCYRDSFNIMERLAQSDPSNAGWQRDFVICCVKLAEIDRRQANALLNRAAGVVSNMQSKGILDARDAWMPREISRLIAALTLRG